MAYLFHEIKLVLHRIHDRMSLRIILFQDNIDIDGLALIFFGTVKDDADLVALAGLDDFSFWPRHRGTIAGRDDCDFHRIGARILKSIRIGALFTAFDFSEIDKQRVECQLVFRRSNCSGL